MEAQKQCYRTESILHRLLQRMAKMEMDSKTKKWCVP